MREAQEKEDFLDKIILPWFDSSFAEEAKAHDIYVQDLYDQHIIDTEQISSTSNPLEILSGSENQPSDEDMDSESWKENGNFGGMKLKAKGEALQAQFMQVYNQKGELPLDLEKEPLSDTQEFIDSVNFPGISEQQLADYREKAGKMEEEGLKIQKREILDMLLEANFDTEHARRICYYCVYYGSVCVETPVIKRKTNLVFIPTGFNSELPNDQDGFALNPTFRTTENLDLKIRPPWRRVFDVEANGDPQAGQFACVIDFLDKNGVIELMGKSGFDRKQLEKILEDADNRGKQSDAQHQYGQAAETKVDKRIGLSGNGSKEFEVLTFWGDISKREFDKWQKEDPESFPQEVYDQLLSDEFYAEPDERGLPRMKSNPEDPEKQMPVIPDTAIFRIHTIYLNRKRVYFSPNRELDRSRPLHNEGLVRLENSNYYYGIFSLGRMPGKTYNKLLRRAIDNENITANSIVLVDPDLIDPDTMEIAPGAVWEADSEAIRRKKLRKLSDGFEQVQFQSVSPNLIAISNILAQLMDEVSMIPRTAIGISPEGDQTATEMQLNASAMQIIVLNWFKALDVGIFAPIVRSFQQTMIVKGMFKDKRARVGARVKVRGADTFFQQNLNKRRIVELINILPNLAQMYPDLFAQINLESIIMQYLEGLGVDEQTILRDKETFNLVKTLSGQVKQMEQMAQQLVSAQQETQKQLMQSQEQIKREKDQNMKLEFENKQMIKSANKLAQQIKKDLKLEVLEKTNNNLNEQIESLLQLLEKAKNEQSQANG